MITAEAKSVSVSHWELARLFTRLSLTAFGGPMAHIAIAEDEIVNRRRWLSRDHYLDLVAATNLIPGPNSTEVMIHVGYVLRGITGALVAGTCFIAPALVLTLVLAVLYLGGAQIPAAQWILLGVQPVIVAIIAQVGWRLLSTALTDRVLWALAITAALVLGLTPLPEVVVMVCSALLYTVYRRPFTVSQLASALMFPLNAVPYAQQAVSSMSGTVLDLFWYFLKIGSILFGSGYVLIAYVQQDVVNGYGWLSDRQLLDAVAIGQVTPGPVLTTVAVVGYIVAGLPGALASALGVFLPSFVLVIATAPLIPKMRQSKFWRAFLSGMNAGVIAAIAITCIDLVGATLYSGSNGSLSLLSVFLLAIALLMLWRTHINPTWLIVAAGLLGLSVGFLGLI